MKQQFIGLQHGKCGVSWKRDIGFFERSGDTVFALQRRRFRKRYEREVERANALALEQTRKI